MTATLAGALPRVTVAPLPGPWRDLLRDGNQGDYATDCGAAMAVAVAMVRAGHSTTDFVREMSDPDNRLARFYARRDDGRRRTPGGQASKMRGDWGRAVRYAADHPQTHNRAEALQHLGLVRAAMDSLLWRGVGGRRDRGVLQALIEAGERRGTVTPAASVRTLAEFTSVGSRGAVHRALKSLSAAGWLAIEQRASATMPAMYRLAVPECVKDSDSAGVKKRDSSLPLPRGGTAVTVIDSSVKPVGQLDRDLALVHGSAAAAIFEVLDEAVPQTPTQIARRSGTSRPTVYKWLARLLKRGLARQCTGGGWLRGEVSPKDEAGEEATTIEMRRVDKHAVERQTWQYRLLQGGRRRRGGRPIEGEEAGRGQRTAPPHQPGVSGSAG